MGVKMKKIVVVGNGSIGMLTAIMVKQVNPKYQVTVIGPQDRHGAASLAAGAMANVLAEVEVSYTGSEALTNRFIEIGLQSRSQWRELLEKTNGEHVITAQDTLVFLKRGASPFEADNFELMSKYVRDGNHGDYATQRQVAAISETIASNMQEAVLIIGEFAYDSRALFEHIDDLAESLNVLKIGLEATQVDLEAEEILLADGQRIAYDNLILAAGARTSQLLPPNTILSMLQGVGSAFVIPKASGLDSLGSHVVRTVNRGGAQCGIHTVPRTDGSLYLGAGNYVTEVGPAQHRIETLRYLFTIFENEYIKPSTAYSLTGEILLGYRPRSIDGLPMVGPLSEYPNVAVCTSMNRVGLTWAPFVARAVVAWTQDTDAFSHFEDWFPDRNPIPYGSDQQALKYFVESRLAAALEHSLISNEDREVEAKRQEIKSAGLELQSLIRGVVPMGEGLSINPDNWNAILGKYPLSCDR